MGGVLMSGFKFMGKDPNGNAKPINTDEKGDLKTRLSSDGLIELYNKFIESLKNPFAVPMETLKFELLYKGDSAISVRSIGADGFLYGNIGSQIWRSEDSGDTLINGLDFNTIAPGDSVKYVTKTNRGFVVVTSNNAANNTKIWYSDIFNSGYSVKAETNKGIVHEFNVDFHHGQLSTIGRDSIGLVGVYQLNVSTSEPLPLFYTENGGLSWTQILQSTAIDINANSHFHHAAYDPYKGRIIASCGDGPLNASLRYSDNRGITWKTIDVGSFGEYSQPTLIVPFYNRLIIAPDSGSIPAAILSLENDNNFKTVGGEKYTPKHLYSIADGAPAGTFYGIPPYVRDGEVAYLPFWDQDNRRIYIVATGDGGNSWHRIYGASMGAGNQLGSTGIVGPDKNGYVFAYYFSGTSRLARAKMIKWSKK